MFSESHKLISSHAVSVAFSMLPALKYLPGIRIEGSPEFNATNRSVDGIETSGNRLAEENMPSISINRYIQLRFRPNTSETPRDDIFSQKKKDGPPNPLPSTRSFCLLHEFVTRRFQHHWSRKS